MVTEKDGNVSVVKPAEHGPLEGGGSMRLAEKLKFSQFFYIRWLYFHFIVQFVRLCSELDIDHPVSI